MNFQKWVKIVIVLALACIWGMSFPRPIQARETAVNLPTCTIESKSIVVTSQADLLEAKFAQPCLEIKLDLPKVMTALEDRINQETSDRISIQNLRYSISEDGITIQADSRLQAIMIGTADLEIEQAIAFELKQGRLYLTVEDLKISSSQRIPTRLIKRKIRQNIERQLNTFNGKPLDFLFFQNGGNTILADLDISRDRLAMLLQNIDKNTNIRVENRGIFASIKTDAIVP